MGLPGELRAAGFTVLATLARRAFRRPTTAAEVDRLFESIRDRAPIRRTPVDQPYELREFEIADPNGYVLVFGENLRGPASA